MPVINYPTTPQTDVRVNRAAIALGAAVIGILVGPGRINPGGPFVSLIGDVLPACASVFAICNVLPFLRASRIGTVWTAAITLCFATLLIGFVLFGVVSFALAPNSRGTLIGL
jgi:hypothetical protein